MNGLQRHDRKLQNAGTYLIGVDEAGRGALAGPVVAGACVLKPGFFSAARALRESHGINDSKQLTAGARASFLETMRQLRIDGFLDFEVGVGTVEEIAEMNILGATRRAMQRALEALENRGEGWQLPSESAAGPLFACVEEPVRILVDGRPLRPFPYAHTAIIQGDGKSLSIAMASIAAKVHRDQLMTELAETHGMYGFPEHKGYGTSTHRAAILEHGASAVHRSLFLRKIFAGAKIQ